MLPEDYIVPKIDWRAVSRKLEIKNGGVYNLDPEEVTHEIAHVYDVAGKEAFVRVGNQIDVSNRVQEKYQTLLARERSEVRVSAITFLALQPLGHADLKLIIGNMLGNLGTAYRSRYKPDQIKLQFLTFIENDQVIAAANRIREFLLDFRE